MYVYSKRCGGLANVQAPRLWTVLSAVQSQGRRAFHTCLNYKKQLNTKKEFPCHASDDHGARASTSQVPLKKPGVNTSTTRLNIYTRLKPGSKLPVAPPTCADNIICNGGVGCDWYHCPAATLSQSYFIKKLKKEFDADDTNDWTHSALQNA